MAITAQQKANLLGVTSFMFNFAPDQDSFARFEAIIEANPSFYALGTNLARTEAYTSQFAEGATRAEKIDLILGRLGLTEGEGYERGVNFINQRLEAGIPEGQVLMEIGEKLLQETPPAGLEDAAAILRNKIDASEAYLESGIEGYSSETLPDLLANITADAASVEEARAAIDAVANEGDTSELTEALAQLVEAQGERADAVEDLEDAVGTVVDLAADNTNIAASPASFAGVTDDELEIYSADAATVVAEARNDLATARKGTSDQALRDDVADKQKAVNDDTVEIYTELGANTGGNLSLRDLQVRAESAYAAVQADYSNKGSTLELAGNLTDAIGNYLAKATTGGTELEAVVSAYQAVLAKVEADADPSAELVTWKAKVDDATAAIFGAATTRDGVDAENTILNASDNADLAPLAQAVEQLLLTFNNRFDLEETAAIREAAFSGVILDEFIGVSDSTGLTFDTTGALAPTAPTIVSDAATAGGAALRSAEDTLEARNDLIKLLADARDAETAVNGAVDAFETAETKLAEAAETLGYEVEEVDNGFEYGTDEADLFLFGEDTPTTVIISDFAADDALYLGGEVVQGDLESADNNQLEFFISSNAAGDAVVQVENTAFGSASENFTEITLTGVSADSLNVDGGLITVVEAA